MDSDEIDELYFQAKQWINRQKGLRDMFVEKVDGSFYEYHKSELQELILGYCEHRAEKDAHNREKGIKRFEKEYKSGSITKDKINKRSYNKFLKISDNINVGIDYLRISKNAKCDGLKGYITNTTLSAREVTASNTGIYGI